MLSTEQEDEAIRRWLGGESQPSIARTFNVAAPTIGNTLRRRGITASMRVALPAAPGGGAAARPAPAPRPDFRGAYGELGAPPTRDLPAGRATDPLATADYLIRALEISAQHVMLDEKYEGTERDRRKELREIARSIATLTPQALLHRAKKMIEDDAGQRDRSAAGPQEEDATSFTGRAHRAPPRRGRPRVQ